MKYLSMKYLLLMITVILCLTIPKVHAECENQEDQTLDFRPNAITLKNIEVFEAPPAYSFFRGRAVQGPSIDNITANTCVQKLEQRTVGVVQEWWLISYKRNNSLARGWVLGKLVERSGTEVINIRRI